ncbi:ATP-binding protein [Sneathiella glossodoripedis]|uniref:ATP-binding protein n=1 Tax=Sneathiella glossodoripedis TaxID=418853 RepID=UPI0004709055|nr:ATP-binding protein [Sneathiella glossodoripedis]
MRSDILSKFLPKSGISLSVLILISQFSLLTLFGVVMLIVTYYSSSLVVESEKERIEEISGIVGDLVLDKELEAISDYTDLLAEELSSLKNSRGFPAEDLIRGAFYSQEEGRIDFIAILDSEGNIITEVSSEFEEYPAIRSSFRTAKPRIQRWNWAIEKRDNGGINNVLLYYQSELVDPRLGRVTGYLLSGIFLKDNSSLMEEILSRSNAISTSLIIDGNTLTHVGEVSRAVIEEYVQTGQFSSAIEGTSVRSLVLGEKVPDLQITTLSILPADFNQSLEELFFLSSGAALLFTLGISILAIYLTHRQILQPLEALIDYAREVGRRELNPIIQPFTISEFNEVGKTLTGVFNDFQESERRFEDIVSIASDIIWETDTEHRYSFIARQPEAKVFDQPQSPLLGTRRDDLAFQEIQGMSWDEYHHILETLQPYKNILFKWSMDDGRVFYFSTSGKPRYDSKGNFLGYRGMSSNITAEVEAQQEAEAAQAQLRQSQKLEVVGQLTGGIAHDFNNLLSVVIGNLELALEDEKLAKPMRKLLNDAMRGAEKGAALTHQLLAYSRQQALHPKRVRPQKVIADIKALLQRAVGEGIDFHLQFEDTWSVLVDPNELENALMNLVVNARDAMNGSGSISLESFNIELDDEYVAGKQELKAGQYVCVVVSDNGSGIEPELMERIFEPFFTTKEVGKGSGLGLSMVFGFAKQSGGHVSIYSEPGEGTSIKLMLPRVFSESDEDTNVSVDDVVKLGQGECVLVVEDNEELRELVKTQLSSIGYETLVCKTGAEALEALIIQDVDIVLSDVILPGSMSGIDIYKYVRSQYPEKAVQLMSGFAGTAFTADKDIPADANILFKPFTKAKLSAALYDARHQSDQT